MPVARIRLPRGDIGDETTSSSRPIKPKDGQVNYQIVGSFVLSTATFAVIPAHVLECRSGFKRAIRILYYLVFTVELIK